LVKEILRYTNLILWGIYKKIFLENMDYVWSHHRGGSRGTPNNCVFMRAKK